jgi:hypothetical protein
VGAFDSNSVTGYGHGTPAARGSLSEVMGSATNLNMCRRVRFTL